MKAPGSPSTSPSSRVPGRASTAPRKQARRRYVLVALVFPAALLLAVALAQVITIPDLNATVPTHWGSGGVDGWGPAWTYPAITAGLGCGVVLLLGLLGLSGAGQSTGTGAGQRLRFLAACSAGTGVFLACTFGFLPGDEDLGPRLAVGILGGAALGGVAAWLAYRFTWDVAAEVEPERPAAAVLAPGDSPVWERKISMGAMGWVLNGLAVVLSVGLLVLAYVTTQNQPQDRAITLSVCLGVAVLILVVFPAVTSARVRIAPDGFSVRSTLGFPRLSVPANNIEAVEVAAVSAMGQFGGWGWRYMPGSGWGVVMSSGEGLTVIKRSGGSVTVTVSGAKEAAALLTAYAEAAKP